MVAIRAVAHFSLSASDVPKRPQFYTDVADAGIYLRCQGTRLSSIAAGTRRGVSQSSLSSTQVHRPIKLGCTA